MGALRIKDVRVTPLMTAEQSISAGPGAALVEVETDEGLTGIGEACVHSEYGEAALATKTIVERGFKNILKGEDPMNIRRLWLKMYEYSEWYGRGGLAIYALSGVDVALWDLAGKALGQPVYRLLGGEFRDRIRVYASTLFNMDDPEGTADEGRQYANEGYTAVKFGWGITREQAFGMDMRKDEEMVRIIREKLGPHMQILVDVGRFVNWTAAHAIRMARILEKYGVYWMEEPLPPEDIDGYSALAQTVDIFIAAGESEYTLAGFKELMTRRAVDIVQPDVTKAGGLTEVRRVVDLAEAWNVMLVPHGFSSAVNVAANLHLVASMPRAFLLEYRKRASPLITELLKQPFTFDRGYLSIPKGPGLGIEIDYSIVDKYSQK